MLLEHIQLPMYPDLLVDSARSSSTIILPATSPGVVVCLYSYPYSYPCLYYAETYAEHHGQAMERQLVKERVIALFDSHSTTHRIGVHSCYYYDAVGSGNENALNGQK